nr:hypothetical protein [uncultured Sphaerochaeta sp.]
MTNEEKITRLRMHITELEKENEKGKKKDWYPRLLRGRVTT